MSKKAMITSALFMNAAQIVGVNKDPSYILTISDNIDEHLPELQTLLNLQE
jgi:hypothetical protein